MPLLEIVTLNSTVKLSVQELNILGKIAVRHFQSFLFPCLDSRHMDPNSCLWPI